MTVFAVILLAAPFLMIVTLVLLALLVKGVHRADLRKPPGNRLDSITRRVVGGARRHDTQMTEKR